MLILGCECCSAYVFIRACVDLSGDEYISCLSLSDLCIGQAWSLRCSGPGRNFNWPARKSCEK